MKTCVIFCAGEFDRLAEPIEAGDFVIAADGGFLHTQKLGIRADVVLGDFDSLGFVPQGGQKFPVEKDDTDAMLALRRGLEEGCDRFVIYGALDGPRLDHTLANIQALLFLAERGATGVLVGCKQIVTVVKGGGLGFPAEAQGILSVFCVGRPATGVTIRGLKYGLEGGTLTADFPLGVSNSFTGKPAQIRVEEGCLIVVYDADGGIIHREEL